MRNLILIKLIILLIFLSSCESINNLQSNLGKPDEDFKNEKGNLELVYKTKKYGISCERKFEIDSKSIVIGFVSKGCF